MKKWNCRSKVDQTAKYRSTLSGDSVYAVLVQCKIVFHIFLFVVQEEALFPSMSGKAKQNKKGGKSKSTALKSSSITATQAQDSTCSRPDVVASAPAQVSGVSGGSSQAQTAKSSRSASSGRQHSQTATAPAHSTAHSQSHAQSQSRSHAHSHSQSQSQSQSGGTTPTPGSPPTSALVGSPLPRATPEEEAQQMFLEFAQRGVKLEDLLRLMEAVKLPVKVLDDGYLLAAEHGHLNVRLFVMISFAFCGLHSLLISLQIIAVLSNKVSSPSCVNSRGESALTLSARNGHIDVSHCLLKVRFVFI